jgi:hypothetical protein
MPSFYSINTYGFGNESVQPNQNTKNNTMSNDIKLGLELSSRSIIRKQQLKVWRELTISTRVFNAEPVVKWNALPIEVRNQPKTLLLALRASNAYGDRYPQAIDIAALVARAQLLNTLKATKIAGEDSPSILAWMGRNKSYLWSTHRYDTSNWYELWQRDKLHAGYENGDGVQAWAANSQQHYNKQRDFCYNNSTNLHNALSWLYRNYRLRNEARNNYQDNLHHNGSGLSVRDRLYRIKEQVYATRAIHWSTSLTPTAYRIANRLRPQGSCLGIELEFIGSSGSDITQWDSDDFPAIPFHSFKHDGSISTNDSNERVCALQEYTAFINGDDESDWNEVFKTLKTMTTSGAIVNNTCGNHVHIDMRHKSNASYYRTAGKMRDAINTWAHRMVSVKRAYNRYCGIQNGHHNNRYTAVNTACWTEHRTVEVRIGMPTLNPNKLKYWSRFLQYLARDRNHCDSFEDFMNGDAPLDLKLYAVRRIKKFESTYLNAGHQPLVAFQQYESAINNLSAIDHDFSNNTII